MKSVALLAAAGLTALFVASGPEKPASVASLLYFASPRLETAPCGCSLAPAGGHEAQKRFLREHRDALGDLALIFVSGASFRSDAPQVQRERTWRSESLVAHWNEIGLGALGVDADDVAALGIDESRRLALRSRFPFVTTNLRSAKDDEPLFQESAIVSRKGRNVLVLAVNGRPAKASGTVRWIEPGEAIRRAVGASTARMRIDLVVVLTSGAVDTGALVDALPLPHVLFGDSGAPDRYDVAQPVVHSLRLQPEDRGRSVAWVKLELKSPIVDFFNEEVSRVATERRAELLGELLELNASLHGPRLAAPARRQAQRRYSDLLDAWEKVDRGPERYSAGSALYSIRFVKLGSR